MNAITDSWKTTLAGLGLSVGILLMAGVSWQSILAAVAAALHGMASQDHGVAK